MLVLLAILCTCFIAGGYSEEKDIGDSCLTDSGSRGTCLLLFDCKRLDPDEALSENVTICAWQGLTPVVCCVQDLATGTPTPVKIPLRNAADSTTTTTSPEIRTLKKKLVAFAKLSKPKTCYKTGVTDFIKAAASDNAGENKTSTPFGTHIGRIAKIKTKASFSEEQLAFFREVYSFRVRNDTFERPNYNFLEENRPCGYVEEMPVVSGSIDGTFYPVYFLNWTLEYLAGKGYVTDVVSTYYDAVDAFNYWNLTFCGTVSFDYVVIDEPIRFEAVGGAPAQRARAMYMALVGEKSDTESRWDCDGALISPLWVLSAAHCFIKRDFEPNYVRLGEYDRDESAKGLWSNFPHDLRIKRIVFHPAFNPHHRDDDLVLLQLEKPAPLLSHYINPICLPWNNVGKSFISRKLTLTGWGATEYLSRSKTSVLQQVSVTVFDPVFCSVLYMSLPDYLEKWPQGIRGDRTMCAGHPKGGRDACQGDSGAPLVYLAPFKFTLAAIVSGGYGCGLKDFPGIYVPVNRPRYLDWIRRVAFSGGEGPGGPVQTSS